MTIKCPHCGKGIPGVTYESQIDDEEVIAIINSNEGWAVAGQAQRILDEGADEETLCNLNINAVRQILPYLKKYNYEQAEEVERYLKEND